MKQYPIRFSKKVINFRIHSDIDSILSMVLDALIEKTLTVYKKIKYEKSGLLSCYNKGKYIFAARVDENNNVTLDFITDDDYKQGNAPDDLKNFILENSEVKPFLETCASYPVSDRQFPWNQK